MVGTAYDHSSRGTPPLISQPLTVFCHVPAPSRATITFPFAAYRLPVEPKPLGADSPMPHTRCAPLAHSSAGRTAAKGYRMSPSTVQGIADTSSMPDSREAGSNCRPSSEESDTMRQE